MYIRIDDRRPLTYDNQNLVRKALYFNYDYYKNQGTHAFTNDDKILRLHVSMLPLFSTYSQHISPKLTNFQPIASTQSAKF